MNTKQTPNRFQINSAADKIDSYFFNRSRTRAGEIEGLEKAKDELIKHLENEIRLVKGMSLEAYKRCKARDFRA